MLSHRVTPLRPTLSSLKVKENLASIENLRAKVKASMDIDKLYEVEGEVLFKDDGLSGIAIFILSQFFEKNKKNIVSLDLYESKTEEQLNKELNNKDLEKQLLGYFPKMINLDLIKRNKNNIGNIIKNYSFEIKDTYGFNTSQVTKGGIKLDEVNLNTFESLKQKDLYISGEVLDVDGTCGGYNLYFAFASAYHIVLDFKKRIGDK